MHLPNTVGRTALVPISWAPQALLANSVSSGRLDQQGTEAEGEQVGTTLHSVRPGEATILAIIRAAVVTKCRRHQLPQGLPCTCPSSRVPAGLCGAGTLPHATDDQRPTRLSEPPSNSKSY